MAIFVSYYRVSTRSQGQSGLGLEAQRESVQRYVRSVGGTLLVEFEEIESGAKSERPQFQAALKMCKSKRAILVIAKLDRLARNVHFVSTLMESGIDFVAADMPSANRLTIHILAAIAEHEREMIAARTREALKAAKARGVKLGNPNWVSAQSRATIASRRKADAFAEKMKSIFAHIDPSGALAPSKLARTLNACGHKPRRAASWTIPSATKVRERIKRLETACG